MAFKVEKKSEAQSYIEIGERLWLKADGESVVAEGDPEAAFLLAVEGEHMSMEDASRYGLLPKAKAKASTKEDAPQEDKGARRMKAK